MNISKKTTFILLLLIIILNCILRYPIAPHEMGWDSFIVHPLVNSLNSFGFAKWWLHPMSIIGSYPYSIASSVAFLLSSISQCTGLNVDLTVFLYSGILGMFSIFIAYSLADAIWDSAIFKLMVAFTFSTVVGILILTSWTCSTRTLFVVVLLPIILYLLLKTNQSKKFYILLLLVLALATVTHHYIYFISVIIVSLIIIKFGGKIGNYIQIKENYINICYTIFFMGLILFPFVTRTFMSGERGYMGSRYAYVLMLIESYFRHSGIILIFAIIGFTYLVLKRQKNSKEWFVLLSFALLSPLFYVETYMKWFILIFLSILAGFSLTNALQNKKQFAAILIILIVAISGYFQYLHSINDKDRYLDERSYISGLWISDGITGNMIGTDEYLILRIFSTSNVPTLTISNTLNYVYGFIEYNENAVVKQYPATSLEFYTGEPYYIEGTDGEWYINALPNWPVNDKHIEDIRERFNVSYFIRSHADNAYTDSLDRSENNKYYSNGKISIWSF